jgi:hypothetical protein
MVQFRYHGTMRYIWKLFGRISSTFSFYLFLSDWGICFKFYFIENVLLITRWFQPAVQMIEVNLLRYNFSRKTGTFYFKALTTMNLISRARFVSIKYLELNKS